VPAGAVTLADITSADWSLQLGAIGSVVEGLDDVEQCIAIILTTAKGSDVLRPTFGADLWRYIDSPIDAALPAVVAETTTAIALWEPRVKLVSVNVAPLIDGTTQSGAHLEVAVTWQLRLDTVPARTWTTNVTI
jgi:Bacteriophage baseplate protein W